jgi:hypothetical protein
LFCVALRRVLLLTQSKRGAALARVCAAHPSLMHAFYGVLPVALLLFVAVASIVRLRVLIR